MSKPLVAVVDHSYHERTNSTQFFFDLLRRDFEVEIFWDEGWKDPRKTYWMGGLKYRAPYKYIFFLQVFPPPGVRQFLACKEIFCIPMFDGMVPLQPPFFLEFKDCRYISFCKTLHSFLIDLGCRSFYLQFFPEENREVQFPGIPSEGASIFFWQRREPVNLSRIAKLLGDALNVKSMHVHRKADPGFEYLNDLVDPAQYSFEMTVSDWFETRSEFHELLENCDVFIAPREYEGIGMAFLEAMAMGKCVVAPDQPTHNEYIVHGENGYLYDPYSEDSLKLENVDLIKRKALDSVRMGRRVFEDQCEQFLVELGVGNFESFGECRSSSDSDADDGSAARSKVNLLKQSVRTVRRLAGGAISQSRSLMRCVAGISLSFLFGRRWSLTSQKKRLD